MPARQELGLQLVAEERRPPTLGRVAEELFVGFLRRPGPPFTVEIVDLATGQLVGAEPAEGTQAEARGLYHVMSADLDLMDRRAFLRKWGRRRRR